MYKLTEGALDKIMNGIDIEKPVIQVLGHKKLTSSNSERYRLLVSDGLRANSFTMLATQLNYLITDNVLTEYTICEISKYALSSVNNSGKEKRVIIILDIEVIAPGNKVGRKIGNPTNMSKPEVETTKPNTSTAAYQHNGTAQKNTSSAHNSSSEISTTPIAALSPYQNKWVIKVRVLTKSQIRTWSNSRGDGKLFTIELVDESGEIRCTAFNNACDKFYDMIEPGNVYYISRCSLKPANKQFNTMKNDFEMTMTNDTEVVLCHENTEDIPTLQFNFSPISQLETMNKDEIIDVLGVVTTFGDLQHIVSQKTGKEHIKRDIHIVDNSGTTVSVTLWGKQAEDFDGSNNPIMAIKSARVGEFNGGKNLSVGITSIIEKDPDFPEAHKLRGWYTAGGHLENVKSLSRTGGGGGGGDINAPLYTFQEATDAKLGEKIDAADVFSVMATINMIRVENSIYKACPLESCKKKLVDQSTGVFKCEKCNKDYPNFVYRLLAMMNIADATGSRWITAFNEDAEKILGMSAQELGELKENDNDAYMQKFGDASFKRFTFGVRVKSEVFQDEMRLRHTCISVSPLNYKTHLAHLLKKVSKLANIEKLEN
ncbi:replication protein A 70 kDa DNA-binding subunit-like [Odontomachus brunneus]|uniref:replication protein A 70 kDa DNA-binding subunit-like n=1 Tax=Odontomachus brunneus TaxID=486640 RepID=UPI0013F20D53|nr:replication protein A 70 kDa DNA-binding subunit-like [Odontomachus brunneus]